MTKYQLRYVAPYQNHLISEFDVGDDNRTVDTHGMTGGFSQLINNIWCNVPKTEAFINDLGKFLEVYKGNDVERDLIELKNKYDLKLYKKRV
jgi:hypothetical protein